MNEELLDVLREWDQLDDVSLKSVYDSESLKKLTDIYQGFRQDSIEEKITEYKFVSLVRELYQEFKECSREYGEIVINVYDLREEGRSAEAIELIKNFVNSCPNEYYKAMAKGFQRSLKNT